MATLNGFDVSDPDFEDAVGTGWQLQGSWDPAGQFGFEDGYAAGYAAGYADGFDDGYAAGFAAGLVAGVPPEPTPPPAVPGVHIAEGDAPPRDLVAEAINRIPQQFKP